MSYTIFRKLETGELLRVATRDDLREAEQLAQKNEPLTVRRGREYPTRKRSPFAPRQLGNNLSVFRPGKDQESQERSISSWSSAVSKNTMPMPIPSCT